MPGEKQYITGPLCISGPIALQPATSVVPSTTMGFSASTSLPSCTACCGDDWSSWKTKWTLRPWMPPVWLTSFSKIWMACCSSWPRNAPPPVSEAITGMSSVLAARAGAASSKAQAEAADAHLVAGLRHAVEPRHHQAADRVERAFFLADRDRQRHQVTHLVDAHETLDLEATVVVANDRRCRLLAAEHDVAHQRLENVVQRDDALEVAVLVDDKQHCRAAAAEELERAQRGDVLRQEQRRPHHRAQVERFVAQQLRQQILHLHDAEEMARLALEHRETREVALDNLAPVLGRRIVEIEAFDLGARRHHRADQPVAEAKCHLDDDVLSLLQMAGSRRLAQQIGDLLLGRRDRLGRRQRQRLEHQLRRPAQQPFERRGEARQHRH